MFVINPYTLVSEEEVLLSSNVQGDLQRQQDWKMNLVGDFSDLSSDLHVIYWQPLNVEHFNSIRKMASELYAYASDARVLTTYYCGEN